MSHFSSCGLLFFFINFSWGILFFSKWYYALWETFLTPPNLCRLKNSPISFPTYFINSSSCNHLCSYVNLSSLYTKRHGTWCYNTIVRTSEPVKRLSLAINRCSFSLGALEGTVACQRSQTTTVEHAAAVRVLSSQNDTGSSFIFQGR